MASQIQMFFSLFVGTLGLIIIFILLFSHTSNKVVNKYLAIVFFITSIRSISSIFDSNTILYNASALYAISLVGIPCFYLYLESLINDINGFERKKIMHFIFPFFLFFYFTFLHDTTVVYYDLIINIFKISVLLFILIYFIKILHIYFKNKKIKKTALNYEIRSKTITKWINFLLLISILILVRLWIVLAFETYSNTTFSGHTNSITQSLLLLIVFLKILLSPEILFGFPKLIQIISIYNEEKINNNLIWITSNDKITNLQEAVLKNKITKKVNTYIIAIDNFVENKKPFRDSKYSMNDLSNNLNIPLSHLSYIFKYHCNTSFVEYKNYSKINDSIDLMKKCYLDTKTFDSLAYKVGFKSYNSFFIYFKKQTYLSPKEYLSNKDIILK